MVVTWWIVAFCAVYYHPTVTHLIGKSGIIIAAGLCFTPLWGLSFLNVQGKSNHLGELINS